MCTKLWLESQKIGDNSEYVGLGGKIMLKWILRKLFEVWIGFVWLKIGTSGGPL
jgi:hypothetical protein